jgi:hypothetical protein
LLYGKPPWPVPGTTRATRTLDIKDARGYGIAELATSDVQRSRAQCYKKGRGRPVWTAIYQTAADRANDSRRRRDPSQERGKYEQGSAFKHHEAGLPAHLLRAALNFNGGSRANCYTKSESRQHAPALDSLRLDRAGAAHCVAYNVNVAPVGSCPAVGENRERTLSGTITHRLRVIPWTYLEVSKELARHEEAYVRLHGDHRGWVQVRGILNWTFMVSSWILLQKDAVDQREVVHALNKLAPRRKLATPDAIRALGRQRPARRDG